MSYISTRQYGACLSGYPVSYVCVNFMDRTLEIDVNHITYFQGASNYTYIHTVRGEKYLICKTLKFLKSRLDERCVRVHKSTLVNIGHISSGNKAARLIRLRCGNAVMISKRQLKLYAQFIKADKSPIEPFARVDGVLDQPARL